LVTPEFSLTDKAVALRKASSDEYQPMLAQLIKAAYEPIFVSHDPATATDIDLNNAFKLYDPAGQRTNMIGLFLALCREAGIAPDVPTRGRPAGITRKPKDGLPQPKTSPKVPLVEPVAAIQPTTAKEVLFHPAVDAFLREARKLTEGEGWNKAARDRVVQGFTTQLDLFLPTKDSAPE
jgi:hypothetical protein